MGIIDEIVPEPLGGAHCDAQRTAGTIKELILRNLNELSEPGKEALLKARYKKFRGMGVIKS
jgi:acetyl-CoA carboxylase carboxyl transferase subunit alpha